MKVTLFGAGNMGGAILEALLGNGCSVTVYDPSETVRNRLSGREGIELATDVIAALNGSEMVFFAVKPVMVGKLCETIKDELVRIDPVVVSVAAGVKTSVYEKYFGSLRIVRTMPNLPALCGKGYTAIFYKNIDDCAVKKAVMDIFSSVGETGEFDSEDKIDKIIPVTSSSPAYVCLLIEAMADGAVRLGFNRKDAYAMCEQAVLGTAAYLKETGMHPAELKDRICSPAGTTIESVAALEEDGFRYAILDAMEKCLKKIG
jgi:pyrroline-5-carboxylate reductase